MKNTTLNFVSKKPRAGKLLLPGCAVAAGLMAVRPVMAADAPKDNASAGVSRPKGAVLTLIVGRSATLPLPANGKYTVESGAEFSEVTVQGDSLTVRAVREGEVRLRVEAPNGIPQVTTLRQISAVTAYVERRARAQVSTEAGATSAVPAAAAPGGAVPAVSVPLIGAPTTGTTAPVEPPPAPPLPALAPVGSTPTVTAPDTTAPAVGTFAPATPPVTGTPAATVPTPGGAMPVPGVAPVSSAGGNIVAAPTLPVSPVTVSPILPPPSSAAVSKVTYRTMPQLPSSVNSRAARSKVPVTQGLARLLAFPKNILAVFFSDPAVMDARAINARTIAVTGIAPGVSTLAVFTQRFPGDVVGQPNVYRVEVTPKAGAGSSTDTRTPEEVQQQVSAALGDPRIRVATFQLPDKSIAVRLTGTVRSDAEIQGAVATASFFAPRVISGLYSDPNVPTLEAVVAGGTYAGMSDADLQANLRRITGNDTIELVSMPTGLAIKAEVGSTGEADSLIRLLPTLNREVVPFIVVRGQDNSTSPIYGQAIPLLRGEDRQLTDRLQMVTGVRTVYAVRAATNGLGVYGQVRTRQEYLRVRRFAQTMAQLSLPIAQKGTDQGGSNVNPTGIEQRLAGYEPAHGYVYPNGVQLFVTITDPTESTVRQVTVQTDVVEISRTSLKNLGVEYGSATLLSESQTVTNSTQLVNGTTVSTPIVTTTRTIDPAFKPGTQQAGNGFAGFGGFSGIDPFRARLNALYTKGDVRILSSPNITAVEGASAQILIGGERPVPRAVTGGNGAVGTDVEFRRYGIMLTLRPTVTDDNSIILQIRADVSQPDNSTAIVVNGATIPGETVRSVDTVLTVKPGEIMVLGGLITNEKRVANSKVPVLGDIPIIGSLFQSRRFDNNQSELAIFMSPRITAMAAGSEFHEWIQRVPALPVLPATQEDNPLNFTNSGAGTK